MSLLSATTKQANVQNITLSQDNSLAQCSLSKEVYEFYNMSYEEKKMELKKDLLTDNYDPIKYKLNLEVNTNLIHDIFTIFHSLPKLNDISGNQKIHPEGKLRHDRLSLQSQFNKRKM